MAEELDLRAGDIAVGVTLRAYRVRLLRGRPDARDHRALRWITAAQLHDLDWVPADRGWLGDLARVL